MFDVQLYISGTRVDLFGDESIQITDSIQDAKDPGAIFTAYSAPFSIPASSTNNQIFTHFYENNIVDGYDARFSLPAEIRVGGLPYKKGSIRVNDVAMKMMSVSSYSIIFIEQGADLKQSVLDSDLSALRYLEKYNHYYALPNVKDGLEVGLSLNGGTTMARSTDGEKPIIYPFITHTKRYLWDSSITNAELYDTTDNNGLEFSQLKPALKLIDIIEAIENDFNITFTRDFFGSTIFDKLYMWLNKDKGLVVGVEDNNTIIENDDFSLTSGTELKNVSGFFYVENPRSPTDFKIEYDLNYSFTITGSGNYSVEAYFYDNYGGKNSLGGLDWGSGNRNFDTVTLSADLTSFDQFPINPIIEVVSEGTITDVDCTLVAEELTDGVGGDTGTYDITSVAPNNFMIIPNQMPKMKIIEFLTSLFKMFNLTQYKKADGEIYVDTLDNFYALGSDIDITDYVDISESTVSAPLPYDAISFSFDGQETILAEARERLQGRKWGDKEYGLGNIFGNSKYEIKPNFAHVMFERLVDVNDDVTLSQLFYAYYVDSDENPIVEKPLIFLNAGTQSIPGGNQLIWSDASDSTSYQKAANTDSITGGGNTIHFGVEADEWDANSIGSGNLYSNYYENYIADVFSNRARMIKCRAVLPPRVITQYNLYDKIIIGNKRHKINSITIDITSGDADLELITE